MRIEVGVRVVTPASTIPGGSNLPDKGSRRQVPGSPLVSSFTSSFLSSRNLTDYSPLWSPSSLVIGTSTLEELGDHDGT